MKDLLFITALQFCHCKFVVDRKLKYFTKVNAKVPRTSCSGCFSLFAYFFRSGQFLLIKIKRAIRPKYDL